jgi:glycosyltransferase involved in cell wall biosynthesis
MSSTPLITVVIPTRNRPQLVKRAVASALAQTLNNIEVVVIIDGPDPLTAATLSTISDPRLRVLPQPESLGGGGARNAGVAAARSEWTAFLDDDDEWLPEKLAQQWEQAKASNHVWPVISCRLTAHTPKGQFVWPRRLLEANEPVGDYVLARNTPFHGEGMIQTSTLFFKTALFAQHPFTADLQRHQEWDWLIRVAAQPGVGFEFVDHPLVIWYAEEQRQSVSNKSHWQYSLDWIQHQQHLVSRRAYAGFLMTVVGAAAAREGDYRAFWVLLQQAVTVGKPKAIDWLLYLSMWLVPQDQRRQLRAFLSRYSHTGHSQTGESSARQPSPQPQQEQAFS